MLLSRQCNACAIVVTKEVCKFACNYCFGAGVHTAVENLLKRLAAFMSTRRGVREVAGTSRWVSVVYVPTATVFASMARVVGHVIRPELNLREACVLTLRRPAQHGHPTVFVVRMSGALNERLDVDAKNLEVRLEWETGRLSGSFSHPVQHYVDFAPYDEPDLTLHVVARPHGPPRVNALDNEVVQFVGYNADTGMVHVRHGVFGPNPVAVGVALLQASARNKRHRGSSLVNQSPMGGPVALTRDFHRARDEAHAPPNALEDFQGRNPRQRHFLTLDDPQVVIVGGSGTGKTACALAKAYGIVKLARRAGRADARCLVSTFTRRNAKRIKRLLRSMHVSDFFEVHTRYEQLMWPEDFRPLRTQASVQEIVRFIRRGQCADVRDADSRKYALAARAFAAFEFEVQIWEEVNNENSTISWLLDLVMRTFAQEHQGRGGTIDAHAPFGGQRLFVTAAVTQLAAMPAGMDAIGRPMGNLHFFDDLFFDCEALNSLMRVRFKENERQQNPRHQLIVRDIEHGCLSVEVRAFITGAIARGHRQRTAETAMPSTSATLNGIELVPDGTPGVMPTHRGAQEMFLTRVRNYLSQNEQLRENVDYLRVKAFHPSTRSVIFAEAEMQALLRNVTFDLYLIPGLLYYAMRTTSVSMEFGVDAMIEHVKAYDLMRCVSVVIHPPNPLSSTGSHLPDFVVTMEVISEPTHPTVMVTSEFLQLYTGIVRGTELRHHGGPRQLQVFAMQLPFKGCDDDSINQNQGDRIPAGRPVILDVRALFTTGQFYVQVSRCEDIDCIEIVGLGRWYTVTRDGSIEILWEKIEEDLHQHPRALLWLESNGYIDDVDLDRYARPLKRARLALLDMQRRDDAAAASFGD